MNLRIRDTAGFVAGTMFLAVGAGAVVIAHDYTIGSALHMGPGYFPIALGILLIVVGAASALRAVAITEDRPVRVALRPLLTIGAAVVVFAAGIDRIGFVPTVFASALLASRATPHSKILEAGLIAACLTVLSAGIFYYGLKLPFALF
jgi:hypothetical protein